MDQNKTADAKPNQSKEADYKKQTKEQKTKCRQSHANADAISFILLYVFFTSSLLLLLRYVLSNERFSFWCFSVPSRLHRTR